MLHSFPFQGEHFSNLQWRGGNVGHFICGNVIYAKPHSREPRKVRDVDHLLLRWPWPGLRGSGPKLLSDYIASATAANYRNSVQSGVLQPDRLD